MIYSGSLFSTRAPSARRSTARPKGEQARSVIDNTKLRHEVSWEPRADLSDGLKKTVEYFRERLR
jgi:nucleoside-diphosphate-sugar epimerase